MYYQSLKKTKGRELFVMIKLKRKELLEKAGNKYSLVILASRRARDINDYLMAKTDIKSQIAKVGPQVDVEAEKSLTIAFHEIAEGLTSAEAKEGD